MPDRQDDGRQDKTALDPAGRTLHVMPSSNVLSASHDPFAYLRRHYEAKDDAYLRQTMRLGACFDFSWAVEEMTGWPVHQFTWGRDAHTIRIHRPNMSPWLGLVDASGYTSEQIVMARYGDAPGGHYQFCYTLETQGERSSDVSLTELAAYILSIPDAPFTTTAFRELAAERLATVGAKSTPRQERS